MEYERCPFDRGITWSVREIQLLLGLWAKDDIQQRLEENIRNTAVYETLSKLLREKGYCRGARQIRCKIKSLKSQHKKASTSESGRRSFRYFHEIDRVVNRPPSITSEGLDSALNIIKMEESPGTENDDDEDDEDEATESADPSASIVKDENVNGEDDDDEDDDDDDAAAAAAVTTQIPTDEPPTNPPPALDTPVEQSRRSVTHAARAAQARTANMDKMETILNRLGDKFLAESRLEFQEMMSRDREWLEQERDQRKEERRDQQRAWQQEWRECQVLMRDLTEGPPGNLTQGHHGNASQGHHGNVSRTHHVNSTESVHGCTPKPQGHVLQAVLLLMRELDGEELQVVCRAAKDRRLSLPRPASLNARIDLTQQPGAGPEGF